MIPLPSPSDELEAEIEAALEELDSSATEAKHHNDPLQLPFSALASFLRAQRRLYADSVVTTRQSIEAARQPLQNDDLIRIVGGALRAHAGTMIRQLSRAFWLGAASILLVSVALAAGAGYWLGRDAGVDLAWSRMNCGDQADGSRVCYYFLRPAAAPAPEAQPQSAPASLTKPNVKPLQINTKK